MSKFLLKNKIAVCFFAIVAIIVVAMLGFNSNKIVYADEVSSAQEATSFYNRNKDLQSVKAIDKSVCFETFYDRFIASENKIFYVKMKDLVSVCECLNAFYNDFIPSDYFASDATGVAQIVQEVKNQVVIDDDFDKVQILSTVANASNEIVSSYQTKEKQFDLCKADTLSEIENSYNEFLSVNDKNPSGNEFTIVNYLDENAIDLALETKQKAIISLNEIVFDNASCKQLMLDMHNLNQNLKQEFSYIDINDIERAVSSINDYYAAVDGKTDLTVDGTLAVAKSYCQNIINDFLPIASSDLIANYSNEISMIKTFLKVGYQGSDYEPKFTNSVETADGAIKIYSYKRINNSESLVEVFPEGAIVKAYNSANGAGKRNAQKAINAKNENLAVGYFIYIDVLVGSKSYEPIVFENADEKLVFKVAIDLEKYYSNYVCDYSGFLEGLLKNSFIRSKMVGNNKKEAINSTNDYISGLNGDSKSSLVYNYYRENGKGEVSALNYGLDTNGGILMFETAKFGSFAASVTGGNNLFLNPIFWIIIASVVVLTVVVVFVLVLVLKNKKYEFSFNSKGGKAVSSVKAKMGESFALPASPEREGYVFGGWFLDEACTIRLIDTVVNKRKNKKVYAKWYESEIPDNFVKYFEHLRDYLMSFSKVGPICHMGLAEKEILAKLFADSNGVYLYLALSAKKISNKGYDVDEATEEYSETPTKITVIDKESYKEAKELIGIMMGNKGLQNVGIGNEVGSMTLQERQEGFEFAVENDRVAVCLGDYYEYLRVYAKSYVLYNANGIEEGTLLTRMYLNDDCIDLYLAAKPTGALVDASSKFEDTPALLKVYDNNEDVYKACEYIDKVMLSNGLERKNENSNTLSLTRPQKGCGCGYAVKIL